MLYVDLSTDPLFFFFFLIEALTSIQKHYIIYKTMSADGIARICLDMISLTPRDKQLYGLCFICIMNVRRYIDNNDSVN